jgi:hypothetical protein
MSNAIGHTLARILRPWFTKKVQTQPDFVIGPHDDPYMHRWYVIPRNRWFNIYLHEFHRSDDDRATHTHPWLSVSLMLNGVIQEIIEDPDAPWFQGKNVARTDRWIEKGAITYRSAKMAHRIVLFNDDWLEHGNPITLFITGPRIREWGFHCPKGWVHWKDFTSNTDGNSLTGRGCDV